MLSFRRIGRWLALLALIIGLPVAAAEGAIKDRRHLFDAQLTPVSAANPALAAVKAWGIEIPASELQAFLKSEPPTAGKQGPMPLADKRELLERLLDEHFLLAAAYRAKADETPALVEMLRGTLNMILQETLVAQEVDAKASDGTDHARRLKEFRERIFDRAKITVANEAFDELKLAAKRVAPEVLNTPSARPLATCEIGTVTVGEVLEVYLRFPVSRRPNLEDRTALIEILRQIMTDALIVAEARERGLEKTAGVQEKLQINRNVLTRFHALDRLTDRAVARLKAPGHEARLRQWYDAHREDLYTAKDANGRAHVVPFEQERESIENDYFDVVLAEIRREEIRALRQDQKIEIDDVGLDRLELTWPR